MRKAIIGGIIAPLVSLVLALAATPALAANCSAYTYTLTNGTTADASQVMSNFNTILNCANLNLPGLASSNTYTSGGQDFAASTTSLASINIAPGTAPTSPNNGDFWITSSGAFVRANGATIQLGGSSAPCTAFGTTSGTCAQGNDSRITGAAQLASANSFSGGTQTFTASASGGASINLPPGTAPTSPNNGDLWTTSSGAFAQIGGSTVYLAPPGPPQGRLTLTTGVPVTQSDVTGATTVYYTPYYGGRFVPIYNGAYLLMTDTGGELSDALDTTNITSGHLYDEFVINSSGTVHNCSGPAWSSTTSRGTGSGTTQLQMLNGVLTNAVQITCRWSSSSTATVSANQATYVGTIYATANGQTTDSARQRLLWNQYNRVLRQLSWVDSTASWTYTTATYRQANGNSSAEFDILSGNAEGGIDISAASPMTNGTGFGGGNVGVGVDSTTTNSGTVDVRYPGGSVQYQTSRSEYVGARLLGYHAYPKLEIGNATGTTTWYGSPDPQGLGPGSLFLGQLQQ